MNQNTVHYHGTYASIGQFFTRSIKGWGFEINVDVVPQPWGFYGILAGDVSFVAFVSFASGFVPTVIYGSTIAIRYGGFQP